MENQRIPIAKCRHCGKPIYKGDKGYLIQAYNKEFGVLHCYTCSDDCANKAVNANVEKTKDHITWLNSIIDLIKNQEVKVDIADI